MDIIKLALIFLSIILVIRFNKPLYIALLAGVVATILLYLINPLDSIRLILKGIFSKNTIYLILAFYTITFLQRMLEKRERIMLAEQALDNMFNCRRINAMAAPFIIGILPSPTAVLIAAPIVDSAVGDYISKEERTFVTTYFRHISELFLPTYAHILLALSLTSISMTSFVGAMLPMAVVLFLLGYFVYIRKIVKQPRNFQPKPKLPEVKNLIKGIWSIVLIIVFVLVFDLPVHLAVIPVIILAIIIDKFKIEEIKPIFKSAFEPKLMLTTIFVMIFKEALTFTGVIERLPGYFEALPIPPVIIFALIFFFGTVVAGSQAIIALTLPLAFATIPNGGLALMILLMSTTFIAMQVSPTHICLGIITEHYGTSFIDLVKKTIPFIFAFLGIVSLYSYLLYLFAN
ncbi:MAG TPA: DUF401 family protein [Tissierellaceae bacterium]|nr:DUF401 family protein [Tissierellaceae bacterium]